MPGSARGTSPRENKMSATQFLEATTALRSILKSLPEMGTPQGEKRETAERAYWLVKCAVLWTRLHLAEAEEGRVGSYPGMERHLSGAWAMAALSPKSVCDDAGHGPKFLDKTELWSEGWSKVRTAEVDTQLLQIGEEVNRLLGWRR